LTCDHGLLVASAAHHLVAVVDGGPKIISFVVDGRLNDGGDARQFGWGRYSAALRGVGGTALRIGDGVLAVRLYARALLTSEAVAASRVPL